MTMQQASLFNHVIVVAEQNSSLTYVENYLSTVEEAKGLANIISEVFTGDNAKIIYGAVDVLAEGFTTYVNRRGVTGRDSRIEWALGLMNDSDTISENITHLVGDDSYCDMKSVVVGRGNQRQNFTSEIVHLGNDTEWYHPETRCHERCSHLQSLTGLEKLQKVQHDRMLFKNHVC